MKTKAEINSLVGVALGTEQTKIADLQAAYFAEHGRYAQLLGSHSALPGEGVAADADRMDLKPTDQADSWASLAAKQGLVLSAKLPAAVEVHAYDGPQGKGFQVLLRALMDGKPWCKSVNSGPETWRERDWEALISET